MTAVPPDIEGELNEETPLLRPSPKRTPTPFPVFQFSLLMLTRFIEPTVAFCMCPFIAELIRNLDVVGDEAKVGRRVGMMQSLFFIAEACTTLQWGRLSDRIGRRPVLLLGLSGVTISMVLFGLSRTFWSLVSRCLCGLLNGNSGVMKSMIADITDETNVAQGSAMLPIVWAVGSTFGPFVGGQLANPADRFPSLFGKVEFWREYPYFLPCSVIAGLACFAFIAIMLFLEETVSTEDALSRKERSVNQPQLSLKDAITPRVAIAIANYGFLALLELAHFSLQPVFYSTKIELGGLGLSVPTIGLMMGITGFWNGLCAVLVFPRLHRKFGTRRVFATAIAAFVPMTALFPILNLLARYTGLGMWTMLALTLQLSISPLMEMGYSCAFMFVNFSAEQRNARSHKWILTDGDIRDSSVCTSAVDHAVFTHDRGKPIGRFICLCRLGLCCACGIQGGLFASVQCRIAQVN